MSTADINTANIDTTDIDNLMAKQAIRDVLANYCRGLDRMDKVLARSVFHQDASVNYYDIYQGSGYGFIDFVWQAHAAMQCHSHQISNVLTEVRADSAVSEAYVTVLLWTKADDNGQQQEITVRGRYLDQWCRQEGKWLITNRIHVTDTHTVNTLCKGPISAQSTRDSSDPSFLLFRQFEQQ